MHYLGQYSVLIVSKSLQFDLLHDRFVQSFVRFLFSLFLPLSPSLFRVLFDVSFYLYTMSTTLVTSSLVVGIAIVEDPLKVFHIKSEVVQVLPVNEMADRDVTVQPDNLANYGTRRSCLA